MASTEPQAIMGVWGQPPAGYRSRAPGQGAQGVFSIGMSKRSGIFGPFWEFWEFQETTRSLNWLFVRWCGPQTQCCGPPFQHWEASAPCLHHCFCMFTASFWRDGCTVVVRFTLCISVKPLYISITNSLSSLTYFC